MKIEEYAKIASSTALYPIIKAGIPIYPALKLAGEAGEFEEALDTLNVKKICHEAGDLTWYLTMIARDIGFEPSVILGQVALLPRGHKRGDVMVAACRVAEAIGKWIRDESQTNQAAAQELIARLCRDVAWAIQAAITPHGITLGEAMAENAKRLASRKVRGVIHGSGDDR